MFGHWASAASTAKGKGNPNSSLATLQVSLIKSQIAQSKPLGAQRNSAWAKDLGASQSEMSPCQCHLCY